MKNSGTDLLFDDDDVAYLYHAPVQNIRNDRAIFVITKRMLDISANLVRFCSLFIHIVQQKAV